MAVSRWLESYTQGPISPFEVKELKNIVIDYLSVPNWYRHQLDDACSDGDYEAMKYCIDKGKYCSSYNLSILIANNISDVRCYDLIDCSFEVKDPTHVSHYDKWLINNSKLRDEDVKPKIMQCIGSSTIPTMATYFSKYPQMKYFVLDFIGRAIVKRQLVSLHYFVVQGITI